MKTRSTLIASTIILSASVFSSMANAAFLTVDSYDMLNGDVGSYSYWDEIYSGSGNVGVSKSVLTGGTGDLTDGIIASGSWDVVEPGNGLRGAFLGDNGPYVGWSNYNPFITFNFAESVNITRVIMHFDNSVNFGGVGGPQSVSFNGDAPLLNTAPKANNTTAALAFDINFTGDTFTTEIFRSATWVFLSEVQFEGTNLSQQNNNAPNAVSAPASMALLGLGLAGLGFSRRQST